MTKIITVSMSADMADSINYRCRGRRARSEWIRDAIQCKLDANDPGDLTLEDASTARIMSELRNRNDVPDRLKAMIEILL
jgi:metal-responsive CopG/Arc/MetJ family transcriptional regulator